MSTDASTTTGVIPEQIKVSWAITFAICWQALRRRIFRSLITMCGIILGIAFLTYMLTIENITRALVSADEAALNIVLQDADVDIYVNAGIDEMLVLLIGLSLFICLVGIINSMLMSVTERVREIGTLKCLGARDGYIVKSFLIESALQGLIGTGIGIAFGILVGVGVSVIKFHGYVFSYFPIMDILLVVLMAAAIGGLISVLAAIGPAYLAARKQPVEAMRVEE